MITMVFCFLFLLLLLRFGFGEEECRTDCDLLGSSKKCQLLDVKQVEHGAGKYFVLDGKDISLKGLYWDKEIHYVSDEWINFEGYRFLFDSANPRSCVNEHVRTKFGDKLLFNVRYAYGLLYGNAKSLYLGTLATIRFGESKGVEISIPFGVGCVSNMFDGFIGYDIISAFHMVLDPVQLKIVMPIVPISSNLIKKDHLGHFIPFEPLIDPRALSKTYNKPIKDEHLWYDIVPYAKLMNDYYHDNFFKRGILNSILSVKVDYVDKPLPASISSKGMTKGDMRKISIDLLSSTRKEPSLFGELFSFHVEIAPLSEEAIKLLNERYRAANNGTINEEDTKMQ